MAGSEHSKQAEQIAGNHRDTHDFEVKPMRLITSITSGDDTTSFICLLATRNALASSDENFI